VRLEARIDHLEKSRLTAPKTEIVEELYVWPLASGLALLLLSLSGAETFWQKVTA